MKTTKSLTAETIRTACAVLLLALMLLPSAFATSAKVDTSTQKSSGFEDLTIWPPFWECTFRRPAFGQAVTFNGQRCMQFWWSEDGYDGTRVDRGIEACSNYATYKEGWFGFNLYLPSNGFPNNREQAIAQVFQNGSCNSWAAMLIVKNNELRLQHRNYCGTPTDVRVVASLQRDVWKPIIIHFVASRQNAGRMEVWYDGALVYQALNINFGFGSFNGNDSLANGNALALKFGLYAYDDFNYTNVSRTLYFDNVCQLVGNPSGAFNTVNPAEGGSGGGSIANGTYRLRNRASGKFLDSRGATTDGAPVGQWDDANSNNLRWTASTVGSYRKLQCVSNGKYLDSLGNTADNTLVGQWASSASNNQQWSFVDMGGGYWKLVNRGNGKALDTGGDNANTANMENWTSGASYNQQWQFTP